MNNNSMVMRQYIDQILNKINMKLKIVVFICNKRQILMKINHKYVNFNNDLNNLKNN